MRAFMWVVRLLLFFVLLAFACKNDQIVDLYFFFNLDWQTRMIFVIVASFSLGAIVGVSTTLSSMLRSRREIGRLRREVTKLKKDLELSAETTAPSMLAKRVR